MGSHGYPPAHWRDIVDRWSFENGEKTILFRPTAAREQGSATIVVCASHLWQLWPSRRAPKH
jgi:hypothetical protein